MKKGVMYIGLSTLLFSTMEIVLKTISNDFNPIQLTLSRFLIGGIILLPFAIKTIKNKKVKFNLSDLKYFSLLGFICVVISMICFQLAVLNTKASVVAVLFSCNPLFVMFLAYFLLKEKIYRHNIISLILELIGIIIITNPINNNLSFTGISFTLLAAITFAIYGVLGKRKCLKFGGIVVTCFSFLLGSMEMLILTLFTRIDFISNALTSKGLGIFADVPLFKGYSVSNLLGVIYIFVFVTGIGYALYFKAMEETTANTTSLIFFFKPALAPILALIILKESIPLNMIIGIIFILVGSITSILPSLLVKKKTIAESSVEICK
ncbi:DMT family transporter [Clostridium sp.]|uniref:DMT family transporter n=1 Tax=Clostridium sp. TaxID=1506 RepID=UPI003217EEAC